MHAGNESFSLVRTLIMCAVSLFAFSQSVPQLETLDFSGGVVDRVFETASHGVTSLTCTGACEVGMLNFNTIIPILCMAMRNET